MTNWGSVVIDGLILLVAVGAALWTGDLRWLWLLVLWAFTGGYILRP